jgi:Xaa-Pro aminopeptidase
VSEPFTFGPASTPPLPLLRARRERLMEAIGAAVVVVPASPELVSSRDTEVPYRPSTDLYYLTGLEEPESCAVLAPRHPEHRFTLFVRPRHPEREAWTGARLGVEGARERLGADAVHDIAELEQRLPELVGDVDRILYPIGTRPELDRKMAELIRGARRTRARSGTGPLALEDLEPTLGELRVVKDAHEVERMRTAARIAVQGHRAAIRSVRPGAGEWEVEAALEGTFRSLGATGPAFPSIVGSGANATTLHYVANQRRILAGELVLIDAGAEWGMYCSDITRTVPASGRFTAPQRAVYEVVLAAEEAGIAAIRPGAPLDAVHHAAVRVLTEGMQRLGLLTGEVDELVESGAYRRFYLHQTSHWLGLDVHDVGPYRDEAAPVPLRPGMVLTVEPGLYIPTDADDVPEPFRGIGIRIEDSVLVTADGAEPLTRELPVDPEEVERLVGGG